MPRWWKVKLDLGAGKEISQTLRDLKREVTTGDARAFFEPLVTRHDAVAGYFDELFTDRGDGGSAFGATWKPLSKGWKEYKAKHGYATRIGLFKVELFDSLTSPGESGNINKVYRRSAIYGTKVDHAKYFNATRPVIAPGDARYLKEYLIDGSGKPAFDIAVRNYKESVLAAVNGKRGTRFKNLLQ